MKKKVRKSDYTTEEVFEAIKKIGEKCTCDNRRYYGYATDMPIYMATDTGGGGGYISASQLNCPVHGDDVRKIANEVMSSILGNIGV